MDVSIPEIPHQVVTALVWSAVIVGFWRGGRDGAIVASVVLAQWAIAWGTGFVKPIPASIAEDAATLAICLAVALRSRRYWTLWAAASPVLSLATQALRLAVDPPTWPYQSAQLAWYLVLIGAVLVGGLTSPAPAPAEGAAR